MRTPEGVYLLKKTVSDGSSWSLSSDYDDYTIQRTFQDGSDWTGSSSKGNLSVHRTFSDGSQWDLNDSLKDTPAFAKIFISFVAIVSQSTKK